ncbi:MAG: outer membrane beta-barrel protein [Spirochaetota bacterium]
MKKLIVILAAFTVLVFAPSASFAIVDMGVYGGYSFGGEIEVENETYDVIGPEYGFIGHVNGTVIPMVLSLGIGGFYQKSTLQYEVDKKDFDLDKTIYGLDAIAMLELPIIIHPYLRGGIAINEKLDLKVNDSSVSYEKKFNSYYFGIGAAFTVFPMVQVFGEYLYNYSKQEEDAVLKTNSVHIGARVNI